LPYLFNNTHSCLITPYLLQQEPRWGKCLKTKTPLRSGRTLNAEWYLSWASSGRTCHLVRVWGCSIPGRLRLRSAGYASKQLPDLGFFSLLSDPAALVGVQRFQVAVLMGMVQRGVLGVLLGVLRETIGGIAVMGRFLMVPRFEMFRSRTVVFYGVLEVMRGLLVGFDDFLVFFGMVSHDDKGIS